jgi:hypothetical protein
MAQNGYEIRLTNDVVLGGDGTLVLDVGQVSNSIVDTSLTSLQLLRRGARSYSEATSENFVHLLENFADDSAPANALIGQLWYDKTSNTMKVFQPTIGSNPQGFYNVGGTGLAVGLANAVNIAVSGDATGTAPFDGTANISIPVSLSNTGVAAGTYFAPIIVVDGSGRISSAANPSPASTADQAAVIAALGYVPANLANSVQNTGGTMTGALLVANANVNVTGSGKLKEGGFDLIPRGVIVMWSGNSTAVPGGWAICDGTNSTPNLRGRFVVASSGFGDMTDGLSGGNNTLNISTAQDGGHTHVITAATAGGHNHGGTGGHSLSVAELPPHTHGLAASSGGVPRIGTGFGYASGSTAGVTGVALTATDPIGNSVAHTHPISADGVHTHVVTAANATTHSHALSFDNRPAFYALAYIMKL